MDPDEFTWRMLLADGSAVDNVGGPLKHPIVLGGKYVLTEYIQSGSYGAVYKGYVSRPDRFPQNAAFKVGLERIEDWTGKSSEWLEGTVLTLLSSPANYVVEILGAFFADFENGANDIHPVIVLELMESNVLHIGDRVAIPAYIKDPADIVNIRTFHYLSIVFRMALDVNYIHGKGMLHVDIKPENFLAKWDRGPDKMPIVKAADLGMGCWGCHQSYEIFRESNKGLDKTAHGRMMEHVDKPDYGACVPGGTAYYYSDWMQTRGLNLRHDKGSESWYNATYNKTLQDAWARGIADLKLVGEISEAAKNRSMDSFRDMSSCAEHKYYVMNDLHCLAVSMCEIAINYNYKNPEIAILEANPNAKGTSWHQEFDGYTTKAFVKSNDMIFRVENSPKASRQLVAAFDNLRVVLRKILQEDSGASMVDLIDTLSFLISKFVYETTRGNPALRNAYNSFARNGPLHL